MIEVYSLNNSSLNHLDQQIIESAHVFDEWLVNFWLGNTKSEQGAEDTAGVTGLIGTTCLG